MPRIIFVVHGETKCINGYDIAILAALLTLCSCANQAQSDLERGVTEEAKGHLPAALAAYEVAKVRDPKSKAGLEAASRADNLRARLGQGTREDKQSSHSTASSTMPAATGDANLGISREGFVDAWNGWAKSKYAKAAQMLNIEKARSAEPGSTFKVDFEFDMEMTISLAPTDLVERVELKLGHVKVVAQNNVEHAVLFGAMQGAAMDCLFAATSPGSDVDAIKRELGGVSGTTTSAVRGNVKYGFSQKMGENEPEFVTAEPASSSPTATSMPQDDVRNSQTVPPPGMVFVHSGSFLMGCDQGKASERPQRSVTLTRSFFIDKTEVTVSGYEQCLTRGKCSQTSIHGPDVKNEEVEKFSPMCNAQHPQRGDHPVNCVDRQQALVYCSFVDKRLPTESEWEYAARGTDGRIYPWGASHFRKRNPSNAQPIAYRIITLPHR